MKKKYKRLQITLIGFALVAIGVSIILFSLKDNILYYYTPQEFKSTKIRFNKLVKIGGFVKKDTLKYLKNGEVKFTLTYKENDIKVSFLGVLPSLIREGQGVVISAFYQGDKKNVQAKQVLAKHDENYLPPNVYEDLKNSDKIDDYFGNN